MAQQALASPIEMLAGNNSLTVNYNAGGAQTKHLTLGTYGCILTVIYRLDGVMGTFNPNLYAYLNTEHKVVLTSGDASGGGTFTVVWTDADLMRMLGFREDLAGDYIYTATDTPRFLWIPPYYSADLNHMEDDTGIAGANAIDGTFSGIALAPGNYTRHHQWQAVAAVDTFKTACEVSYAYPTPPGTAFYYPEEERCLEQFSINALSASPSGTEGLSIKGCYYIEDLAVYEGETAGASNCPLSMNGGGHRTRLTTTPDNYTFCHLKPSRWDKPTPTIPTHNSLYNVGVELITSIGGVPTWSAPV